MAFSDGYAAAGTGTRRLRRLLKHGLAECPQLRNPVHVSEKHGGTGNPGWTTVSCSASRSGVGPDKFVAGIGHNIRFTTPDNAAYSILKLAVLFSTSGGAMAGSRGSPPQTDWPVCQKLPCGKENGQLGIHDSIMSRTPASFLSFEEAACYAICIDLQCRSTGGKLHKLSFSRPICTGLRMIGLGGS